MIPQIFSPGKTIHLYQTNAKSFGWCCPLCNIAIVNYNSNVKFKMHYFGTLESH